MARTQSRRTHHPRRREVLPAPLVLNAFELEFERHLSVPVIMYEVTRVGDRVANPAENAVSAMWNHRRNNRDTARGSGSILGVSDTVVATSESWDLPSGVESGWNIQRKVRINVSSSSDHTSVLLALLRDAIKQHFKSFTTESTSNLGPLWKDYGDYCQMPDDDLGISVCFCRKFSVRPKVLSDGRLVVQIIVSTVTLDERPIAAHLERGNGDNIVDHVTTTLENYSTRNGDPAKVRAWWDQRERGGTGAKVVEIAEPDALVELAKSPREEQKLQSRVSIPCIEFPDKRLNLPLAELRFIKSSWGTGELHRHTILSPAERASLRQEVVDILDGFQVADVRTKVHSKPVAAERYKLLNVLPPSVRVRDEWGEPRIIKSASRLSADGLRRRSRHRAVAVGKHGFLRSSPLKPLLAWPSHVLRHQGKPERTDHELVDAMKATLNRRMEERQVSAHFESFVFTDVNELRQRVESGNYDAMLAVLPEPSRHVYQSDDTHELIKQAIGIPSQCIHWDNTVDRRVALQDESGLADSERKRLRQGIQKYDLCINNLLVKCGWLPYLPTEPFQFNVHVGIDVGGRNNDTVVVSLCHGLADPDGEVVFRVQRIPVDVKQPEPIPSQSLTAGLRSIFDFVRKELEASGLPIGFEDVLFFRDGAILGRADQWNEMEGLTRLLQGLKDDSIVSGTGKWAVVEAHKRGVLWRVEAVRDGEHENPIVGQCVVGLEEADRALVSTTGQPYLTQGTADPTVVRLRVLCGEVDFSSALQDYLWEADLGFTKMDMGHALPWILRLADSGALNLSRSYKSDGIIA